jgi:hypothetical protein
MPFFAKIGNRSFPTSYVTVGAILFISIGLWTIPLLAGWTSFGLEDYVEYWAAGRLIARGENPYDPAAIHREELEASPDLTEAIMMWNPPWALTVAVPFGWLPPHMGHGIWLFLQSLLVFFCGDWVWQHYGGPPSHRWLACAVTLGFAPTFLAVRMGQITPLVLLGIVGFLHFQKRGQGFWAGAAASLAAIKPHLAVFFALALWLWLLQYRRWSIAFGGFVTLLVMTAIPLAYNPAVIGQYLFAVSQYPPRFLCPTPGSLLRLVFGEDKLWLNLIPAIFGLVWFGFHWRSRRHSWDWKDQVSILFFASLLTATYGVWPFDLVVLLLPVLHAAVTVFLSRNIHAARFGLTALFGFNVLAVLFMNVKYTDQYWNVWMTPMLLYCYWRLRGHGDGQLQSAE